MKRKGGGSYYTLSFEVTFKNDESLDAFQVSGELHVGDFILMVTKIKERKQEQISTETPQQQSDWSYQRSFLSRPPPLYGMMYLQNGLLFPCFKES